MKGNKNLLQIGLDKGGHYTLAVALVLILFEQIELFFGISIFVGLLALYFKYKKGLHDDSL
jgi:hypothetical protein